MKNLLLIFLFLTIQSASAQVYKYLVVADVNGVHILKSSDKQVINKFCEHWTNIPSVYNLTFKSHFAEVNTNSYHLYIEAKRVNKRGKLKRLKRKELRHYYYEKSKEKEKTTAIQGKEFAISY